MINRKTFAAAAERDYKTVKYTETDCQQFIENCAAEAGYKFNSRGTNDMWRNYMDEQGGTAFYPLAIGDVVYKWRAESDKLPSKYRGDGLGDFYHIGIITGIEPYTVCHSANSKENGKKDTYSTKEQLAAVWTHCGTLKNTAAENSTEKLSIDAAIVLLEEAKKILEYIAKL